MNLIGRLACATGVLLALCPVFFAEPKPGATPAFRTAPTEKNLEQLSRALKQKNPSSAYSRLSGLANQKSSGVLGMRAALALGYFDYTKGNYSQAAKWLDRAKGDPLLRDYSVYWSAETKLAQGRDADALAEFKQFRSDFPDSVMTDQALQSLGEAALASKRPADAIVALDAYSLTAARPTLLFLRGQAHEHAGEPLQAAADYQAIYLRFATSEQAREAGTKLSFLRSTLGEKIPPIPLNERISHAAALYYAKDWDEARNEYTQLVPELSGEERERAELRILECGVALGAGPSEMASLKITDADVDAERFLSLAQIFRTQQRETDLVAAVEAAVSRAPTSRWAEASLLLAGNYYWVQFDRDRAAGYYKRLEENFPTAPDASAAQWRVAWVGVLKRQTDATELLADHLRRFPGSTFTPDALYWLGRLAEEAGNSALARSYYGKLAERYPENYFEDSAVARLNALGPAQQTDSDVLAMIPPLPPALTLGDIIPPAAVERQARADALRSLAFDASAELELHAAYVATGEPRLLLEVAQAAANAGHYGAAIVSVRQVFPELEARPFAMVPREVWLTAYSLPFEGSIRQWSAKAGVDPMLVAGLIRQESAFDPESRSNKNALGLMQLLPKTGRLMAKKARVRFSQSRLYDADYNIRLGTLYLAGLRKDFGSVEAALAAYNGGEDRVIFWTSGRTYREPAEFVDSIPFTETREYVEIVMRNANIYRNLYGGQHRSRQVGARPKH
jgi:soluble lytic murein transglycosylase